MQVLHTSVEVDIFQRNFRKNSKRNRSTNAPIKLYVKSLYTHVSTKTKKKFRETLDDQLTYARMTQKNLHHRERLAYGACQEILNAFCDFLYIFLSCSCWDFVSLLWTFFYTLQQSKKSLKVYVSSLAVL